MREKIIEIATKDGGMDTFICHPERGGPSPVVIFYMDAPGIREELYDMARRIASTGYYVALPNLYYRHGTGVTFSKESVNPKSAEHKRMFEYLASLNNGLIVEDTAALLPAIDKDPAARKERIGTIGYCMSGPFVTTVAAKFPDRIAAAASIYGVGLVTDKPDSPHLLLDRVRGELYFAWAELDTHAPLKQVEPLRAALDKAGTKFEIEIYPKTEHGFAFPQRHCYDKASAERHWERLFALFERTLR